MWYFTIAVSIVVISSLATLKSGLQWAGRFLPQRPALHLIATQLTPGLLFFLAAPPYLLALTYVHRFRIPNLETPAAIIGRPAEAVEFVTNDGVTIRGWFIPAKSTSERTVVICHGLGGNCTQFVGMIAIADLLDSNALLFDFRGHGGSDGHTVTMGHFEKHDVSAAVNYLRTVRPGEARQIVGLAVSMGTSALVLAAAELERPLDAVLLDSGFASAIDLTDNVLGFIPAAVRPWLTTLGIPLASLHAGCHLPDVLPEDCIARIRAPVILTHFEHDPLIPAAHAARLFARAAEPKALFVAPAAGHGGALFAVGTPFLDAARGLLVAR